MRDGVRRQSAISSHPIGQKFVTPTTSLKVQPTYADGHSKVLILQRSRTRSRRAGRHLMNALRQQLDRPNWRCRSIGDIDASAIAAVELTLKTAPSKGADRDFKARVDGHPSFGALECTGSILEMLAPRRSR